MPSGPWQTSWQGQAAQAGRTETSVIHVSDRQVVVGTSPREGARESPHAMRSPLSGAAAFWLAVAIIPSPTALQASPAAADSVHVCAIYDYEQWRRDRPRPAAKLLADLDVGEPRTVRMIYFLPNDRPFRQEVVDSIKVRIRQVQSFYVDQMEAHGHGTRTLRIETDAQGEPLVHRVDGQHPDSHYLDNTHVVYGEIEQVFDLQESIYLVVVDHSSGTIGLGGGRVAGGTGGGYKKRGSALVPASVNFGVVAHELGHAFGLLHDFRDNAYVMSYGRHDEVSACAAEFLAVNPYFNDDSSLESDWERRPTAELVSSPAYEAGTTGVPIQLALGDRAGDSEGLHQVILFAATRDIGITAGGSEIKECQGLSGESDADVEFEYDGEIPSSFFSSLSDPIAHPIRVQAINSEGDVGHASFLLSEISPHLQATLDAHGQEVNAVAFSPDGKTLASSGSWGQEGKLWWVSGQRLWATLEGHTDAVSSVAFSADGTTVATGSWDRTIKLWDSRSGGFIATLEGHTDGVASVAFSGGGTLAAGLRDGTVKLWDAETRGPIDILDGHTGRVTSVSFSPDGSLLASAGGWEDRTVKVWDMGTREWIASLEDHTSEVTSVSFSPDGAILASASSDRAIILWDVETWDALATLEGHASGVTSVSFSSPDGSILASGSRDGTAILWDLLTRRKIAAFGHAGELLSVSLSSGGSRLAAGGRDGAVLLWDVSDWTGPRPWEVEIVSGDGQQGAPGVALGNPLVVEVRDQYGDLLPEAAVTFAVNAGDGKLSGRFAVEHATTDAEGRAELPLTLGLHPGPNTVGVSIGGRELATFHAEGVGTVVAELEGDYRTWHLPPAARVRLGKGALGERATGRWLSRRTAAAWRWPAPSACGCTRRPRPVPSRCCGVRARSIRWRSPSTAPWLRDWTTAGSSCGR